MRSAAAAWTRSASRPRGCDVERSRPTLGRSSTRLHSCGGGGRAAAGHDLAVPPPPPTRSPGGHDLLDPLDRAARRLDVSWCRCCRPPTAAPRRPMQQSDEEAGIDSVSFSTFDPDMTSGRCVGRHKRVADRSAAGIESDRSARTDSHRARGRPLRTTNRQRSRRKTHRPKIVPEVARRDVHRFGFDTRWPRSTHSSAICWMRRLRPTRPNPPPQHRQTKRTERPKQPVGESNARPRRTTPAQPVSTRRSTCRHRCRDARKRLRQPPRPSQRSKLCCAPAAMPSTEAAVEAALRFLAEAQRSDGAWDPRASGAGKERAPLGTPRGGAGARAETAITGLALLTLIGAGNTHQTGDYADNVYRGLAYLIETKTPAVRLPVTRRSTPPTTATAWRRWRSAKPPRSRVIPPRFYPAQRAVSPYPSDAASHNRRLALHRGRPR